MARTRTEQLAGGGGSPPRRRGRKWGRQRWWLWAGIASLLVGGVLGALLVSDLTSRTPGSLQLPAAGPGTSTATIAAGPASGRWSVGPGSEVEYRVHEVLFGIHHTAVGRTSAVSGGMVVSGRRVVAADFSVEMGKVRSHQAGRNVAWRDFIMYTARYPQARFRLTRPITLPGVPAVGKVVRVPATGELTLRGVTRTVQLTLSAERTSTSTIDVDTDLTVVFRQWRIPNPSFAITKVANHGTLEVLLHLRRGG